MEVRRSSSRPERWDFVIAAGPDGVDPAGQYQGLDGAIHDDQDATWVVLAEEGVEEAHLALEEQAIDGEDEAGAQEPHVVKPSRLFGQEGEGVSRRHKRRSQRLDKGHWSCVFGHHERSFLAMIVLLMMRKESRVV